jgi:type I restriction enzyme, S subunit
VSWQTVPLREILAQKGEKIRLEPGKQYKQITVRLWGKGLTLRGSCDGAEIAAESQVQVRAGNFLISKIDARHGAFGLVPHELDGAVVSNDFPCFDVNSSRVDARFLNWFSKTDKFVSLCRQSSVGSTNRVRLKESRFLNLEIPLPPISQQINIARQLDDVESKLNARQAALRTIERDAQAMLFNAFQDIVRDAKWKPLGDVAPLVRREIAIEPNVAYTEIGVRSFFNGIFHRRTMLGSEFSWQKLFRVQENDLVFSNLMAWEQAIAVARPEDHGCVGNHRMLTCAVNLQHAVPAFLLFYFRTPEGFSRIIGNSPGSIARNKTLSTNKLPAIEVPAPDIDLQRRFGELCVLVNRVEATRAAIARDADALLPGMLHDIFERQDIKLQISSPSNEKFPSSTVVKQVIETHDAFARKAFSK